MDRSLHAVGHAANLGESYTQPQACSYKQDATGHKKGMALMLKSSAMKLCKGFIMRRFENGSDLDGSSWLRSMARVLSEAGNRRQRSDIIGCV
jgi:hypothetical protein